MPFLPPSFCLSCSHEILSGQSSHRNLTSLCLQSDLRVLPDSYCKNEGHKICIAYSSEDPYRNGGMYRSCLFFPLCSMFPHKTHNSWYHFLHFNRTGF